LDASQVELARRFVSDDRLLEVGIGPAGTGKTTAMRAFERSLVLWKRAAAAS
jgi:ABC-type phosphate transport system ATPase subunit